MRLLTIGCAVFALSACVSNPAQDKAWQDALQSLARTHEHVLQSLDSAKDREAQLSAETVALKREVERLSRDMDEMNAEIEALHARADAVNTHSVSADPAVSTFHSIDAPTSKRTAAPSAYATTSRTNNTARASQSDRLSPPLTFTPRAKASTGRVQPLAKTRTTSEVSRTPRRKSRKSDSL
jgi:hypothetical protein